MTQSLRSAGTSNQIRLGIFTELRRGQRCSRGAGDAGATALDRWFHAGTLAQQAAGSPVLFLATGWVLGVWGGEAPWVEKAVRRWRGIRKSRESSALCRGRKD